MRVNALGGLFSFLPKEFLANNRIGWVCQCPRRAILISTDFSLHLRSKIMVSMPSAGYSHFYVTFISDDKTPVKLVSMPSAGYSHFYRA